MEDKDLLKNLTFDESDGIFEHHYETGADISYSKTAPQIVKIKCPCGEVFAYKLEFSQIGEYEIEQIEKLNNFNKGEENENSNN